MDRSRISGRCARFGRRARRLAALAAFFACATTVAQPPLADAPALGPAPQRHESQDASGWITAPARPGASARDAFPNADGPLSRTAVALLYRNVYLPGDAVPIGWTGSVATCNPGTTSLAHRQAVIDRVNYARALAGLPGVALSASATVTAQQQAAALIMSANNDLDHFPPSSWLCYSPAGSNGASSSNLALGAYGIEAVDLYLDDPGAGNEPVGHRRWILFPPRAEMATGDVPATSGHWASNALHVFGPSTTRPATPNGVAWPPAGYVPYQNLPYSSNRWSLSYPGANFSAATVTIVGPSGPLAVAVDSRTDNGYGDNTIVFRPSGVSYTRPASDVTYAVTVSGIQGAGVPATIAYGVTVIDPDRVGAVRSDFGADGRGDVLWRETSSGNLGMWAMNGATPMWSSIGAVSPGWTVRGTGDFDGDGRADILWRETGTGNVSIWFMNGNVPTPAALGATSTAWSIAGIGDFNGDGRSDVLWRDAGGTLGVWLMNGASATWAWIGATSTAWTVAGIGDFDGDGRSDILWRESATGNVGVYLMNGASGTWRSLGGASTAWNVQGVGDFDGDGESDVLWREAATGYMLIWFMNAANPTPAWVGYASPAWTIQSVTDFDGDGRADVLWRQPATGEVGVYLMNGATPTWAYVGATSTGWVVQP